ncbi:unnamed protein product [Calypogeia fissa]
MPKKIAESTPVKKKDPPKRKDPLIQESILRLVLPLEPFDREKLKGPYSDPDSDNLMGDFTKMENLLSQTKTRIRTMEAKLLKLSSIETTLLKVSGWPGCGASLILYNIEKILDGFPRDTAVELEARKVVDQKKIRSLQSSVSRIKHQLDELRGVKKRLLMALGSLEPVLEIKEAMAVMKAISSDLERLFGLEKEVVLPMGDDLSEAFAPGFVSPTVSKPPGFCKPYSKPTISSFTGREVPFVTNAETYWNPPPRDLPHTSLVTTSSGMAYPTGEPQEELPVFECPVFEKGKEKVPE